MTRHRLTPSNMRVLVPMYQHGIPIVQKRRNAKGQAKPVHVLPLPDGEERPVHGTLMRALPGTRWVKRTNVGSAVHYLMTPAGERLIRLALGGQKSGDFIPPDDLGLKCLLDTEQVQMPKKTDSTGKYLTRHGVAELLAGEGNPPISQVEVARYIRLGLPRVSHGKYDADAVLPWFHRHLVNAIRKDWLESHATFFRAQAATRATQHPLSGTAELRSTVSSMLTSLENYPDAEISQLCEGYLDELEVVYTAAGYPGEARRAILEDRARKERRASVLAQLLTGQRYEDEACKHTEKGNVHCQLPAGHTGSHWARRVDDGTRVLYEWNAAS